MPSSRSLPLDSPRDIPEEDALSSSYISSWISFSTFLADAALVPLGGRDELDETILKLFRRSGIDGETVADI